MNLQAPARSARRWLARLLGSRRVRPLLIVPAVLVLCALGVGLYINERDSLEHKYSSGSSKAANRVDLLVTVQQVDVTNGDLVLRLLPDPQGKLLARDGTPAKPLTIAIISETAPELHFDAGQSIAQRTVRTSLQSDGTVTDYPFDHYTTVLIFDAAANGRQVPLHVSLRELDPSFLTKVKTTISLSGAVFEEIRISRSRGTLILAWFMMIAMWALALAVLGGARVITRRRQGMVWPAMGWMAATLFALIGMRNAAPGAPPIGSLIDYASFFWAEAIVAASLVVTAWSGIRSEHAAFLREQARDRER